MMVRFSCFPSHIHCHKQKKSAQLCTEPMHMNLEDCTQSGTSKNSNYLSSTSPAHSNMEGEAFGNRDDHVIGLSSTEQDSKTEEIERKSYFVSDLGNKTFGMKKCMSLGSGLDRKGKVSAENDSEDETDKKFSSNGSLSQCEVNGSLSQCEVIVPDSSRNFSNCMNNIQENDEVVNIESTFSIADPQQNGKEGQESSSLQISGAVKSDEHTPRTPCIMVKSSSLPNIHSPFQHSSFLLSHSRSAEDLNVLDSRHKDMSTYEPGTELLQHGERDISVLNKEKCNRELAADDTYDAYNYMGSAKDWIVPEGEEVNANNHSQEKFSLFCKDDPLRENFKIKRIEDWVMGLQHYSTSEDTSELSPIDHELPKDNISLSAPAVKLDDKVNPSSDAVKKYISSLSAASTAAQLVNHGLVVIPFLSAFTSLRVLNLSGNSIVRITAGSLPRGLHVLNLSKNSISTVEGLRELTRIRVLDLSYNRILRIGHGLASCSSLKELYLAGNKISEVEGLHRLLKLNVLDLRFNKISTTKCLGQLAANYNSLQAIGVEGNPAQKNIGDEQLKKYLQGLLPHLAYYNRQPMRGGILKDAVDRSARVGIISHQIERNHRAELKIGRKSTHSSHKAVSSSIHGRKSQVVASSKTPRSRNGLLPPTGSKIDDHHHFNDFSSKIQNLKTHLSIRRSRSEGALGAL